jgi:hypothetical protein
MSIHGILAALLGSTALGGFAPLTVTTGIRHTIIGIQSQSIGMANTLGHFLLGVPKNHLLAPWVAMHTLFAVTGVMIHSTVQHILLGFIGILASEASLHTMIYEVDMSGYGYDYGGSYGE